MAKDGGDAKEAPAGPGPLDAEEARLYEALLALVGDQLASVRKAAASRFAFWGKGKIQARNKDIETCLSRIIDCKVDTHGEAALSAILGDLNAIEDDCGRWPDVSADQINCVRQILRNV